MKFGHINIQVTQQDIDNAQKINPIVNALRRHTNILCLTLEDKTLYKSQNKFQYVKPLSRSVLRFMKRIEQGKSVSPFNFHFNVWGWERFPETDIQRHHISTLKKYLDQIWFPCDIILGSIEPGHENDMVVTGDGLRCLRYTITDDNKCIVNYNLGGMGHFKNIPLNTPIDFEIICQACENYVEEYSWEAKRKLHPNSPFFSKESEEELKEWRRKN